MFHLLVSYGGWPDGGGSISTNRVYIRLDDSIQSVFLNDDGTLDVNKIRELPALFVPETGSDAPQIARVGYITDVKQNSSETHIQYTFDHSIPPISNKALESFAAPLSIGRFGLTHTCWTINEADLFRILLLETKKSLPSPTAFSIEPSGREIENLASVMMPFSAEFDLVYATLQEAISSAGMTCMRADNFWEDQTIIQDIVSLIVQAQVVVCDCTGRNPNVFYEAGIAHTLGKDVIFLAQNPDDIPFDLRHIRYIRYLNNSEGLASLASSLQQRLETIMMSSAA